MSTWSDWCVGTLRGVDAVNSVAADTAWAWSCAESWDPRLTANPLDVLMRWFNPLNTTEKMIGSHDSGAQPGPHDVQIYSSVGMGITATCATLSNGYYPTILANLRNGVPYRAWGNAGVQLGKWGTGIGWLGRAFPPRPFIKEIDMQESDVKGALRIALLAARPGQMPSDVSVLTWYQAYTQNGSNLDAMVKGMFANPAIVAEHAQIAAAEQGKAGVPGAQGDPGPQGIPGPEGPAGPEGPSVDPAIVEKGVLQRIVDAIAKALGLTS